MNRPMTFDELKLAVLEIAAAKAMAAELEQALLDAERVRDLVRMRCTVRPSRWCRADRELLRQRRELQRSLRALGREHHARVLAARRAEYAVQHVTLAQAHYHCQTTRAGHVTTPKYGSARND